MNNIIFNEPFLSYISIIDSKIESIDPLLICIDAMSSSSQENSPNSTTGSGRHFSLSRDKFDINIPSPQVSLVTNSDLISPNSLKSPNGRRIAAFSRDCILGSAQRAQNLSQSSPDREPITNGIQKRQNQSRHVNGTQNQNGNSDDGINPLKRRSTDEGIDYPRRRATIAVRIPALHNDDN